MKLNFRNPKFITTAIKPEHYPKKGLFPEIAVVGRSNVGKSSLLNDLFKAKNLVKTSSTPGKTQAINFFSCEGEPLFADLPGYGYAKVPHVEKKKWGEMIEAYLKSRPSVILFLVDSRRVPSEEDLQMYNWIQASGLPVILVLTKVDKLNQGERVAQTDLIMGMLNIPLTVHYSTVKKEGREALIRALLEVLCS